MEAGRIRSPSNTTNTMAGKIAARPGWDSSVPGPSPSRITWTVTETGERVTPPSPAPTWGREGGVQKRCGSRGGKVQRTHLSPQASIPGEQALPTPGSGEKTQNAGGVPFSTLRCCVPEAPGGPGPPGTPGRSPSTQANPIRLTWSGARGGGVASLAHSPRAPCRSPLRNRRNSAAEAAILR